MFCINGVFIKVDQSSVHNVVKKIKFVVTPEVQKPDVNGLCRICLSTHSDSDLFNLFSTNQFFESVSISTAIQECFGVAICEDDNLPNSVCFQCATSTLQAYTFKNLILQGEETLKVEENDELPIIDDNEDDQNENIRTPSPLSIVDNQSFIESYDCSLSSIASDHNYSKELTAIGLLTPETSLSTAPVKIESEANDAEICDNLDVNFTKSETFIENVGNLLSTTVDKWWIKSSGPPYECKLCSRNYGSCHSSFYRHVRTHFINKVSCLECGKKYTKDKLKHHMYSHNLEKPFVCHQCPARFTLQANLKRHATVHNGLKPFICDYCGKGFTQNSSMKNHRQAHIGTTVFVCEYCGKTFPAHSYYRHHKRRYHNGVKSEPSENENEMIHKCDKCDRGFKSLRSLHQHSTRVHQESDYRCNICALDIRTKFKYQVHTFIHELQTSDNLTNDCKFCLDTFSNKTNLQQHLLDHIEKPHQCKLCYKSFTKRCNLIHHTRQHSEDRPYPCKDCAKTFRNPTTLYQHEKIHSGKKPHLCLICLRTFTQQQHLSSHMLTHTGEKKYVCQYCGKAFALNGNLTVHIRRHTGDTPFYCIVCGKGFHDTSSRKKHMVWKHNGECKQGECAEENL